MHTRFLPIRRQCMMHNERAITVCAERSQIGITDPFQSGDKRLDEPQDLPFQFVRRPSVIPNVKHLRNRRTAARLGYCPFPRLIQETMRHLSALVTPLSPLDHEDTADIGNRGGVIDSYRINLRLYLGTQFQDQVPCRSFDEYLTHLTTCNS